MDPKTLPTLDPKLKEAYERVMGTSFASPQAEPPPPPPPAIQPVPPVIQDKPVISPAQSRVAAPVVQKAADPITSSPVTPVTPRTTTTFVAGNATPTKGKGGISPVILLFAGLAFFAVYALFWLKFFNLKLPF